MNEPQSHSQRQYHISSFKQTMKQYFFENWDITVNTRQQIGNKQSMEDVVWFQPPFRNEEDEYTYLQMFVLDGHHVFPLKLEEVRKSAVYLTTNPLTKHSVQHWATQEDNSWHHNIDGGVVIQFLSVRFKEMHSETTCFIKRFQIGDCNSIVFNQKEIILPCMNSHNVQNETERWRFKDSIQDGRILGVLQCTRVIGNKHLKKLLKLDSLDPILEYESKLIKNKKSFIIALGSDGCFQDSLKTSILIQSVQSLRPFHIQRIGDVWMNQSSGSDNASLILVAFKANSHI